MPPKKKPRLSSRAASAPSGDAIENPAERPRIPMALDTAQSHVLADPWTDEQETSLFKAMIRWKPVGMHKHLRMIAISEHLRNHGYTSPSDDHTRIPHIWKKLRSLYNLEALDERENFLDNQRPEDGDSKDEPFCPFTLPEEEFGEMMFAKRFKPEGSSSPMLLPNSSSAIGGTGGRRPSFVDDTDEPRSSPAPLRGRGSTRGTRGPRRSHLQEVSIPGATRRGQKSTKEDAVEANQKEHAENDDSVEEESDAGKPNSRTPINKTASASAKKRRSVRRR